MKKKIERKLWYVVKTYQGVHGRKEGSSMTAQTWRANKAEMEDRGLQEGNLRRQRDP